MKIQLRISLLRVLFTCCQFTFGSFVNWIMHYTRNPPGKPLLHQRLAWVQIFAIDVCYGYIHAEWSTAQKIDHAQAMQFALVRKWDVKGVQVQLVKCGIYHEKVGVSQTWCVLYIRVSHVLREAGLFGLGTIIIKIIILTRQDKTQTKTRARRED